MTTQTHINPPELAKNLAGLDQPVLEQDVKLPVEQQEVAKTQEANIEKLKELAIKYAGIIDSRESIYRSVLDFVSSDIPTMLSNANRGLASFLESTIEGLMGTGTFLFAPFITKCSANFAARFILPLEELDHVDNYLKFHMPELRDQESFEEGLKRIKSEEAQDQKRIAQLYKSLGKEKQVESYTNKAKNIEDFCDSCEFSKEKLQRIYNVKKAAILTESALEGGFWGAFGLLLRLFRKYVLGQNRFTGTSKYINDDDSKKIGEAEKLSLSQKILGSAMIPLSPIVNSIFLKMTKNKEAADQSPMLKKVEENIDMTHGVFPKLGLMFTYSSMPKWISALIGAQGADERLERLAKFAIFIPSWWLGHKVTNGTLAAKADKKLSEKFGVEQGILLEKSELGKATPEPARIHHVLKITEGNEELQKEAIKEHAKVLYSGLGLHSVAMMAIFFGVNFMTKIRALGKLSKVKD
jgi:hypothetical protein